MWSGVCRGFCDGVRIAVHDTRFFCRERRQGGFCDELSFFMGWEVVFGWDIGEVI